MAYVKSNRIFVLLDFSDGIVSGSKFHEHGNPVEHYCDYTLPDWSHGNGYHFNGNVLMFDDGRYRAPRFNRALELAVDPKRGRAEIGW